MQLWAQLSESKNSSNIAKIRNRIKEMLKMLNSKDRTMQEMPKPPRHKGRSTNKDRRPKDRQKPRQRQTDKDRPKNRNKDKMKQIVKPRSECNMKSTSTLNSRI